MPDDLPSDAKLICPACFARDIDPVMLRRDSGNGEYYCIFCSYVAPDKPSVVAFLHDLILHKYAIDRPGF